MNAQLSIGNTAVRQFDNLYSLNDLHIASGGESKNKPANFLRAEQTQSLINEINQVSDMRLALKVVHGGDNRGTFACKELVYAYAMWISPKFMLEVIHAYDAMVTSVVQMPHLAPRFVTHPHSDPWSPMVYRYITARVNRHVGAFTLDELSENAIGIRASALGRSERIRLGRIMRTMGFERRRESVEVNGKPRKYFYRVDQNVEIINPYEVLTGEWEHAPQPIASTSPCMSEADKHNLLALLTYIPVLNEDAKPLLEIGRQLQSKPLISLWSMIDHLYFLSHGCTKAVQAMP